MTTIKIKPIFTGEWPNRATNEPKPNQFFWNVPNWTTEHSEYSHNVNICIHQWVFSDVLHRWQPSETILRIHAWYDPANGSLMDDAIKVAEQTCAKMNAEPDYRPRGAIWVGTKAELQAAFHRQSMPWGDKL